MHRQTFHVRIGDGRRVVLPSELCRSLSVRVGDTLVVRIEDGRATLNSVDRMIDRFQSLVAARVPQDISLVDELIADREAAALHE
ncbi:MAG: AbrB/MazE/SpoVT family DNA-binding domain-containing protein [Planctomycetaceae bacterium]|nr:AbrB/MazE/SpoVT family DNA-binding domain-containing protein [Planctomycetaceae bacterium]